MNPSFNLVDEPWIPVIWGDGRPDELGLRDVLLSSHQLSEVVAPSPVITASLYRLLLALAQRVLGLEKEQDWPALWNLTEFPTDTFNAYLDHWGPRFELFHESRPFYQSTEDEVRESAAKPISKLCQEASSGNNPLVFDHSFDDDPVPLSYAEAARVLIATQAYALGGGVSKPFNFSHAPLIAGALVLLKGSNLQETLLLNLLPYNTQGPIPGDEKDCPAWERDQLLPAEKRAPHGYLDYLTWQSRRLLLIPEHGVVRGVHLLQGSAVSSDSLVDAMMAVHRRDDTKGFLPLRFQEERGLWRDAHVLLAESGELHRRPQTLEYLAERQERIAQSGLPVWLDVIGLCTDQAKVNYWRHERMPLPLAYLRDEELAGNVQLLVDDAEAGASALGSALWTLATRMLAPDSDSPEGRSPDKEVVRKLRDSFPSRRHFWAGLEPPFYEHFTRLPDAPDETLDEWRDVVRRMAREALRVTTANLDGSARALKAAVAAERALNYQLKKHLPVETGATEGAAEHV